METPLVDGLCYCPGAGVVKYFHLTIDTMLVTPPGLTIPKSMITVNGTWPGAAIVVDEGDWVVVTVKNLLDDPTTASEFVIQIMPQSLI